MMRRPALPALACLLVLAASAPAAAQLGAATSSPPPAGIADGAGAANPQGHYGALDALPDWGGIWFRSVSQRAPGASPPPPAKLKGDYLADYQDWQRQVRENDGLVPRDRSNCSPPGMPIIMQTFQYPYEFLFTPGRVTINQEAWMQTRTIWTDGRAHPPLDELDPTFHGHSIGHWENGTLVVDTIGIETALDMVYGAPHSDQFSVQERIFLSPDDPDMLVNEMTFTDPEALEEPYETTILYRRDRYGALIEFQCSQNDRNPVDENGETQFN